MISATTMNTKLIHHRGIHKALPTCYTYWQKIIGRLSSTRVTHVAMGTASTSAIPKCFLPWESTKIILQGGSLSIIVNKAKSCENLDHQWCSWPLLLPTRVGPRMKHMKHLQYLRRCSHSGSCKCGPLPLYDPDSEPITPTQAASLESRAGHFL